MTELLFGKGAPSPKRIYIWNLITSLLYSAQSALLLLVVTRAGGLEAAGIFSIAYTVTQTLASLGSYSMRNYQVSDTRGEFPFRTYYSSRVVTCLVMIAADLGYALLHGMQDEELVRFAAACSAIAVSRFPLPLNPPKPEEVQELMANERITGSAGTDT